MTSVPIGSAALGEAMANQRVGRAAFDHPFRRGPVGILYGDVNPGVRIDHFNLHYSAPQFNRLVCVEFGGESVMRG